MQQRAGTIAPRGPFSSSAMLGNIGDEPIDFEKGSVESTHKVPTSHYLALALTK